jgi:hypothetical protein
MRKGRSSTLSHVAAMSRAMDGNTEGRRLRKKRRPFPLGVRLLAVGEDQRLMASFSIFLLIS